MPLTMGETVGGLAASSLHAECLDKVLLSAQCCADATSDCANARVVGLGLSGQQLRGSLPGVPCIALTATATPQVRADVCESLRLRDREAGALFTAIESFDRPNLHYSCVHSSCKLGAHGARGGGRTGKGGGKQRPSARRHRPAIVLTHSLEIDPVAVRVQRRRTVDAAIAATWLSCSSVGLAAACELYMGTGTGGASLKRTWHATTSCVARRATAARK